MPPLAVKVTLAVLFFLHFFPLLRRSCLASFASTGHGREVSGLVYRSVNDHLLSKSADGAVNGSHSRLCGTQRPRTSLWNTRLPRRMDCHHRAIMGRPPDMSMNFTKTTLSSAIIVVIVGASVLWAPVAHARGDGPSDCMPSVTAAGNAPPALDGALTPLRIVAQDWSTSYAVAHALSIALRERAGTPAEVMLDTNTSITNAVSLVNSGAAHVLPEAWSSTMAVFAPNSGIDTEAVDVVGALGPESRSGWYFPSRMLDERSWLAGDLAALDTEVADTLGDDVFGGTVLSGPSSWNSELSCMEGGIFDNLGLGLECTRVASELELLSELETRYSNEEDFLVFLWRPLAAMSRYNLTRARLGCSEPECFAKLTCDYQPARILKLAWTEIPVFYSSLAVELIEHFQMSTESVEGIVAAAEAEAGGAATEADIEAAACVWAGNHSAEIEEFVHPERALAILSVHPSVVAARGGDVVTLRGTGFGRVQPDTFFAEVGGVLCTATTWVSQTEATCDVAPGAGEGHDVRLVVGAASTVASGALSFEPARVYGVVTEGGSAAIGQHVIVTGDNFVSSPLMQCRFDDTPTPATFINFTAVACVVPTLAKGRARGVVPVAVTNDGSRWLGGIELEPVETIVWPGGTVGLTPLDLSAESAPAELVIVLGVVVLRETAVPAAELLLSKINADPTLLRHTTLKLVMPDVSHIGALRTEERQVAFHEVMAGVREEHPGAVAVLGGLSSSISIPFALASAEAEEPWVMMSWTSTNPGLSDPEMYPYFFRTCPSDLKVATAMVESLVFLEPVLAVNDLIDLDTRAIGVYAVFDDPFSWGLAEALIDQAAAAGFRVDPVAGVDWELLPSAEDEPEARAQALQDSFAPLVEADVRVIAYLAGFSLIQELVDAAEAAGIADRRRLFLYPDTTPRGMPFALAPTFIDGDENDPRKVELIEYTTAVAPDADELIWPLALTDILYGYARAFDYLISEKRSPHAVDYGSADELRGVLREHSQRWPHASTFGGFTVDEEHNDPITASFALYEIDGEAVRQVGTVESGTVRLTSTVGLPSGSGFAFEAPTHVTLGVAVDSTTSITLINNVLAGIESAMRQLNYKVLFEGAGGLMDPVSSSLIADVQLQLDVVDISDGGPAAALERLIERASLSNDDERRVLAGVVTLTSAQSLAVLEEAKRHGLAVISPSATLDDLASAEHYPLFGRVVSRDSLQAAALADLAHRFDWKTCATVYVSDEPYSTGLESGFVEATRLVSVRVAQRISISISSGPANIRAALTPVIGADIRIFVLLALEDHVCAVFRAAMELGIVGPGYVWLGGDGWIGSSDCGPSETPALDNDAFVAATEGSIGTQPQQELGVSSKPLLDIIAEVLHDAPDTSIVHGDAAMVSSIETWRSDAFTAHEEADAERVELMYAAARGYDLVLVASDVVARMVKATQHIEIGATFLAFWRLTSGVVGSSAVLSYKPQSNDPTFAVQDVMSRRGSTSVTMALQRVGMHSGRSWVSMDGCPAGHERLSVDGACTLCPQNTWKSHVGDETCSACPIRGIHKTTTDGVVGATSVSQCLCPAGLVHDESEALIDGFPCAKCPEGGVCEGIGLRITHVRNAIGWWRGHPNATSFERCFSDQACPIEGLPIILDVNSYENAALVGETFRYTTPCPAGALPPLCGVCAPRYGLSNGVCVQCSDPTLSRLGFCAMVTGTMLLAVYLARQAFLRSEKASVASQRRTNNTRVLVDIFQFVSFVGSFNVDWGSALQKLFSLEATLTTAASIITYDCIDGDGSGGNIAPAVTEFIVYVLWPTAALVALLLALFVSRVLGHLWSVEYHLERSWGEDARFLWPDACTCCLRGARRARAIGTHTGAVFSVKGVRGNSFDVRRAQDFMVALFCVLLSLLYPRLVFTTFSLFDCTDVGGLQRLRVDLSVSCEGVEYENLLVFARIALALLVFGYPSLVAYMLFRARRHLFLPGATSTRNGAHISVSMDDVAEVNAALLRAHDLHNWMDQDDFRVTKSRGMVRMGSLARMLRSSDAGQNGAGVLSARMMKAPAALQASGSDKEPSMFRRDSARSVKQGGTRAFLASPCLGKMLGKHDPSLTRQRFQQRIFKVAEEDIVLRLRRIFDVLLDSLQNDADRQLRGFSRAETMSALRPEGGDMWYSRRTVGDDDASSDGVQTVLKRAGVFTTNSNRVIVGDLGMAGLGGAGLGYDGAHTVSPGSSFRSATSQAAGGTRLSGLESRSVRSNVTRASRQQSAASLAATGLPVSEDESASDADAGPHHSISMHSLRAGPLSAITPVSQTSASTPSSTLPTVSSEWSWLRSVRSQHRRARKVFSRMLRRRILLEAAFEDVSVRIFDGVDQRSVVEKIMCRPPRIYNPTLREAFSDLMERLDGIGVQQRRFSFAFQLYRPGLWYSELLMLSRKLLMITCSVFLASSSTNLQVAAGLGIVAVSLIFSWFLKPYATTSLYNRNPKYMPKHLRSLRKLLLLYLAKKRFASANKAKPEALMHMHERKRLSLPYEEVLRENWSRDLQWSAELRKHLVPKIEAAQSPSEAEQLQRQLRVLEARRSGRPSRFKPLRDPPLPFVAWLPEVVTTDSLEMIALLVTLANLTCALLIDDQTTGGVGGDGLDAAEAETLTGVMLLVNGIVIFVFFLVLLCDFVSDLITLESAGAEKLMVLRDFLTVVKNTGKRARGSRVASEMSVATTKAMIAAEGAVATQRRSSIADVHGSAPLVAEIQSGDELETKDIPGSVTGSAAEAQSAPPNGSRRPSNVGPSELHALP